jgi:succinyl-CoA synthetase alpha subunit
MAILIDETKRVLVQGITGREGRARTKLMREYGTNLVAGVKETAISAIAPAFISQGAVFHASELFSK